MKKQSNYDLNPSFSVAGSAVSCWDEIAPILRQQQVLILECYPGVDQQQLKQNLLPALPPDWQLLEMETLRLPSDQIEQLLSRHLGSDRVFGYLAPFQLADFYSATVIENSCANMPQQQLCIYGTGASLMLPYFPQATLVYVSITRWQIQQQMRSGMANWSIDNPTEDILRKYKRGFFIEWRAADRQKKRLFDRIDYYLDGNDCQQPTMVTGSDYRNALQSLCQQPFRVRPFFDPAPWGGQWMRQVCGLPEQEKNYGWCFDGVPEENSLLLDFANGQLEVPAIDLVLYQPIALLGEQNFARFGAEFPIRFDFLDTFSGGNLSLQVHPDADYIYQNFGIRYTQDESYYLLDSAADGSVYLGLQNGVEPGKMIAALQEAQQGEKPFPAEQFVNRFPANKHDHVLIPAGTVHCSGSNTMVLEISATPYIFTFKIWDWGRLGLDGLPRPIHLEHGKQVIRWDRNRQWVSANLINQVYQTAAGDGWREEHTGLHQLEFIETRRTWFSKAFTVESGNTVTVLNLVEGSAATISSPDGLFAPYQVHYIETVIIPAAIPRFTVTPANNSQHALLRAWVRSNA